MSKLLIPKEYCSKIRLFSPEIELQWYIQIPFPEQYIFKPCRPEASGNKTKNPSKSQICSSRKAILSNISLPCTQLLNMLGKEINFPENEIE